VREQQFNANDLHAFVEACQQLLIAKQKLSYESIASAVLNGRSDMFIVFCGGRMAHFALKLPFYHNYILPKFRRVTFLKIQE